MKKSILLIGMLLLGISMITSSLILSKSLNDSKQLNGVLNGSLTMNEPYHADSDILMPYDAAIMFGYNQDDFIKKINDGELAGIPYTQIGGQYIFSKKALEEWIYSKMPK